MFQKNDNKSATLSILICAIDLLRKVGCNINENVEDIDRTISTVKYGVFL